MYCLFAAIFVSSALLYTVDANYYLDVKSFTSPPPDPATCVSTTGHMKFDTNGRIVGNFTLYDKLDSLMFIVQGMPGATVGTDPFLLSGETCINLKQKDEPWSFFINALGKKTCQQVPDKANGTITPVRPPLDQFSDAKLNEEFRIRILLLVDLDAAGLETIDVTKISTITPYVRHLCIFDITGNVVEKK